MNIGIDFDGVIADSFSLKSTYLKKRFDILIKNNKASKNELINIIGKKKYSKMISELYQKQENFYPRVVKYARKSIKQLSKKHKIIIVTSRNKNESKIAKIWLENKKINYDKFHNTNNTGKEQACKKFKLDYLIEDNPNILKEITTNRTKLILLKRPYNSIKCKKRIKRLSWKEILKLLK